MLDARDTANSLVSTEPITFRGSMSFLDSKAGVAIGPQSPPPVASKNPATKPSGIKNTLDPVFFFDFQRPARVDQKPDKNIEAKGDQKNRNVRF